MSDREAMLRAIAADAEMTGGLTGKAVIDRRVMAAMAEVDRQKFVPPDEAWLAFENIPLPIGDGQTISQPFIVALMTDLLAPRPGDVVLEVGAGSGYQAAVLSRLVARVETIEIVAALGERAYRVLRARGYDNISVHVGDGFKGWPRGGPYDGIIVTAAAIEVPPPLVAQLKPGGRLVIPVGGALGDQVLAVIEKSAAGEIARRDVLGVRFVPLTGGHGAAPPKKRFGDAGTP